MSSGMDPGRMTPAERMDEVGMLLSLAMMRLWLQRRSRAGGDGGMGRDLSRVGEDCLELPPETSPDGPVQRRKEFFE